MTLFIVPTDQQYNASLGLKGKLSNSMSYNVSGHYIADRNNVGDTKGFSLAKS